MPSTSSEGEGNVAIVTDLNGCELLQIKFQKEGGRQQILLSTQYGEILAQCGPAPSTPGEFHLLRGRGEYFAKLVQGSTCDEHLVQTAFGADMTFMGSGQVLKVFDTEGRLLAMTEPETEGRASSSENETYLLRVAPLMDVSIVMCGLFIVDHLI